MFTAIILSAKPVTLQLEGVVVLPSVQVLNNPAELHNARLAAITRVTTPYCFFLDDDDELPAGYMTVLSRCVAEMVARKVPMAYTDEILREPGKDDVRRCWYEYDSECHRRAPMGVHHLVVMSTPAVQALAAQLPRGNYWTEHMLYWALGRQGAAYVPEVGYIWNRNVAGFSRSPRILAAQSASQRWINVEVAKCL